MPPKTLGCFSPFINSRGDSIQKIIFSSAAHCYSELIDGRHLLSEEVKCSCHFQEYNWDVSQVSDSGRVSLLISVRLITKITVSCDGWDP